MKESLKKYIDPQVITFQSTTSLDKIKKPEIYICQTGQYNYLTSRYLGYKYHKDFLAGYTNTSNIAHWSGIHKNQTFDKLIESMFEYDYSDVYVEDWHKKCTIKTKKIFINPFGVCMKMKNFDPIKVLFVTSTKRMKIIYVDSNFADNVRVLISSDAFVKVGNIHGTFKGTDYLVTYHVTDNSLKEGKDCLDYAKIGSSYGECIERAVYSQLEDWYGCTPPWFPNATKAGADLA